MNLGKTLAPLAVLLAPLLPAFVATGFVAPGFVAPAAAADWPQFRGPNRDGVSPEAQAPLAWGPDRNVKWKAPLPRPGNSSPIVSGDRVFVTCAEDARGAGRSLYCFSRADGRKLWSRTVQFDKPDPTHGRNPYCASTPAADGKSVTVWHGSAGVFCYDYDGNPLWSRDLGEFRHVWGYASSPVLYGDVVLLNCGPGPRSFVTALDRKTGKTLWQTDEPGGAEDKDATGNWLGSWASPVVARVDGRDQVLIPQPHQVKAYDPATGKVLWTCGGTGPLAYCDVTPGEGVAVAASGYTAPAIGFKLGGFKPGGSGDVIETNRLWRVEHNPQRIGTGVVVGPHLFMVNEPGFSCIEMATGNALWKHQPEHQTFWGSMVKVGDRLYATSQSGATFVFAADPKAFRLLATNEMNDEGSNSTPAVSDGQLFLRTFKNLYCIQER